MLIILTQLGTLEGVDVVMGPRVDEWMASIPENRKGFSRRKAAHQRNSQAVQRKGLPCRIDGSRTTQANSILHSETARSPDSRESRPDNPAKANIWAPEAEVTKTVVL